jgi:hypothetical protein
VSVYLFQVPSSHSRRIREGSRLKAVKASSPLRVATAVTEAVAAVGIAAQPVVWGWAEVVVVPVRCMWKQQPPSWGIREAVVVGSRPCVEGVGTPRAPERCRVPYWRDALP